MLSGDRSSSSTVESVAGPQEGTRTNDAWLSRAQVAWRGAR